MVKAMNMLYTDVLVCYFLLGGEGKCCVLEWVQRSYFVSHVTMMIMQDVAYENFGFCASTARVDPDKSESETPVSSVPFPPDSVPK